MLLLEQMIVLFLIMGVGFFCYRKSIITDEVSKKLSSIVVFIANPAMILSSGMAEDRIEGSELVLMMILAIVTYGALILLACILPLILRIDHKSRGAYRAMTVFPNIVFMGFPLIASVYGEGALLYATMFIIFFNVLIYTYGITVMQKADKTDDGSAPKHKLELGRIFNVGVIACIVSIIIYLSGVQIPTFVQKTANQLGSLTAPLSMMIIGASLATINIKRLFLDFKLLAFCLIRLILVPILGIALIRLFVDHRAILGVCMVMLATPVASMTSMLAQQYNGDHEMTVKGVALSTILSVATMPLVQLLLGLA